MSAIIAGAALREEIKKIRTSTDGDRRRESEEKLEEGYLEWAVI